MPRLEDLIPDAAVLIGLDPEELGGLLLQALETEQDTHNGMFHISNYSSALFRTYIETGRMHRDTVRRDFLVPSQSTSNLPVGFFRFCQFIQFRCGFIIPHHFDCSQV